ncbi:hypothetical protein DY000_02025070 [Brassica cretica]|uniref:Uncharacterized protein n=1 Tax=Brassica cretica TaxID=69181 RepID=A0ABQ7E8N6_BRACR|nr:hypothetical protein DY000_02025070 [Brassica cretica]
MAYSFILLADLKACCCSDTAEVCLLRFMEAQNVKNLSDSWLRRHQNQRLMEPSIVFFHVVPHGLGKAKIISKLILLWELLQIYVEMLFINKQHYKFVNRTMKVEPTPEDTKVDKEEEEPHKENKGVPIFLLTAMKNNDINSKEMTPLLEKAIRSAMLLIRFREMGDISSTMAGALSTAKEPRA